VIKEQLVEVVTSGIVDLGAPILGLMSDDELLAGDPIPPQAGVDGNDTIFNMNSNAIVKNANLWDEMVSENQIQERKKAEYEEAKRN